MSKSLQEKKMADAMRIFEALSGVDEELLARCEEATKELPVRKVRPFSFLYYRKALAACFCLVVCGAVLWSVRAVVLDQSASSSDSAVNLESIEEEMAAAEACEDTAKTTGIAMSEGTEENGLTAESGNQDANPAFAENGNQDANPASAEDSAAEAGDEGMAVQESGNASVASTATTQAGKQDVLSEAEVLGQSGNQTGNTTEQLQGQGDKGVTESCSQCNSEEITLSEAKETLLLGAYVPNVLPSGYTLESAYREKNQETGETECIMLCWTKGMDSILWTVSKADAVGAATVDVSKPETYDVRLYEIPYGETVPEQYRGTFDNPVFAEADFSLDVVKARMKAVSDTGDTGTPRGNFAVLYESGVLVTFNGRGAAESIYEMFP